MVKRTNIKMANAFKMMLHKKDKTNYLAICKDKSGKNDVKEFSGSLKRNWQELSDLNEKGYNIFMLINSVRGERRTADQIHKVNALFIDYDGGDWSVDKDNIDNFLDKFPVKPHMVVNSSRGCYHAYWLVNDVELVQFSSIQKKLAAKFNSDPKVHDLPRVMRMPGTTNWKREKPFSARFIYKDDNPTALSFSFFNSEMFGSGQQTTSNTSTASMAVVASPKSDEADDLALRVTNALHLIPAGDRTIWITVGMALKDAFGEDGLQMFKDWSSKSTKYDKQELERQWKSFKAKGGITIRTLFYLAKSFGDMPIISAKNLPKDTNPLALGEHFAQVSKLQLRYCETENAFYVFINGKWVKSNKNAERMAINYLSNLLDAATQIGNEALRKFVGRNQSVSTARELLRAAESNPLLKVNSAAFDSDKNILAVKRPDIPETIERHDVIHLGRNKSRRATPDDMVLQIAGVNYDPKEKCPQWLAFIDQITKGDTDLAEFLQLVVGYTFYGHTKEQVMFVFIGSAGNGKGIFARITSKLLGDYAVVMQSSLLKPGAINGNSPSPALMKLKSKRLWVCSEVPKGMVLDEALVKQITGGDIVSSRQLYGQQVEFLPVGKLWLLVNDMPRVRHDDMGMWRRIVPIPFDAVFTGSNRDNDLEEKLLTELPGILNWGLEGARKYATAGKLEQPAASKKLLSALRRDVDTVGLWIKSRCIKTDEGNLQSKVAYDDYCDTMKREKAQQLPQKEFKADLQRRGYLHRTGRNFNYFIGLEIKAS